MSFRSITFIVSSSSRSYNSLTHINDVNLVCIVYHTKHASTEHLAHEGDEKLTCCRADSYERYDDSVGRYQLMFDVICLFLQYKIGQLYMIARHSHEQSEKGTGVEVIKNEDCVDEKHGPGRFTEKRIHLSSRLPYWVQSFCPQIFYVIEKAWNYFPYTITEYSCSFIPKLNISIHTKFENNAGTSDNVSN